MDVSLAAQTAVAALRDDRAPVVDRAREAWRVVDGLGGAGSLRSAPEATDSDKGAAGGLAFAGLEAWLAELGVDMSRVGLKHVEALGCNGVVCREALEAGAMAFAVPREGMITAEDALAGVLAPLATKSPVLRGNEMLALALQLLIEDRKGEASRFAPYLAVLPRSFAGLPMLWPPEDLAALEGTHAGDMAVKRLLNVIMYYCHVSQLLDGAKPTGDLARLAGLTLADMLWAMCVVMTRQNPLPRAANADQSTLALIPLFDMCNHEAGQFSTGYSPETDALHCSAQRDFAQGDEFRIFYGPRNNNELLVYSGFVLPPGENTAHRAVAPLAIYESDQYGVVKSMLLKGAGLGPREFLALSTNDARTMSFARAAAAAKEDVEALLRAQQEQRQQDQVQVQEGRGRRRPRAIEAVSDAHEAAARAWLRAQAREHASGLRARLEQLGEPGNGPLDCARRLLEGDLAALEGLLAAQTDASAADASADASAAAHGDADNAAAAAPASPPKDPTPDEA